jgi:hypothetical protein
MIEASLLAALIAGVGEAALLAARPGTAMGSAVALAAITMEADEEGGAAVRAAAADGQQDDRLSMRHAQAAPALDNRKRFLSP